MESLQSMLATPLGVIEWLVYLLASVIFVIGLHFMNSPKTARKGNLLSAGGMVLACAMAALVLVIKESEQGFAHAPAVGLLVAGIVLGALAGVISAKRVKMTDMPQLVSIFNTVGGGAAALVALNDVLNSQVDALTIVVLITAGLGMLIGSVTFSGSLVAAGKLQGLRWMRNLRIPAKNVFNIGFGLLMFVSLILLCVNPEQRVLWSLLTCVFALCYGLVFVIPIGGADMPVVISVLNACTGTAVAMSGLAIMNIALIVAGALVGSAGVTLSIAMSKAMNRPLLSVLAGGFGSDAAGSDDAGVSGTMKETTPDDVAVQLVYAQKVVFVPGFGLAQAQAQRELADLGMMLQEHGVEVSYAIHPVAGRMPGHMNVLLAEANVPYEQLVDLDDINSQFPQTSVALVVGANDVTNPAARRPGTAVSGMPILDVDKAQHVVVMKRGRGKGYAGIENELYFQDNTQMLFGDAKDGLQAVIAAVKELLA